MSDHFACIIEIGDDTPEARQLLAAKLMDIADQVAVGGITRQVRAGRDNTGNTIGYWAIAPRALKIDFKE